MPKRKAAKPFKVTATSERISPRRRYYISFRSSLPSWRTPGSLDTYRPWDYNRSDRKINVVPFDDEEEVGETGVMHASMKTKYKYF